MGEAHLFADCFEAVYSIRNELLKVFKRKNTTVILTDSACSFYVILRISQTSEKHLMIDLDTTKEAHERSDTDEIGWITTTKNVAEAFTKKTTNLALENHLDTGNIISNVKQCVNKDNRKRLNDNTKNQEAASNKTETMSQLCQREDGANVSI